MIWNCEDIQTPRSFHQQVLCRLPINQFATNYLPIKTTSLLNVLAVPNGSTQSHQPSSRSDQHRNATCSKISHETPPTPITAFSSDMVICFARSTAVKTCCWCSWDRNGTIWVIIAFNLLEISVCEKKKKKEDKGKLVKMKHN